MDGTTLSQGDILNLIAKAPPRTVQARFESEGEAFDLTLNCFAQGELNTIQKTCIRQELQKEARQFLPTTDRAKLNRLLADKAIQGWTGLTGRKLAVFCRRQVDLNGHAEALERELECNQTLRLFLLEHAVQIKPAGMTSFTDWVWDQLTSAADTVAALEDEKKVD